MFQFSFSSLGNPELPLLAFAQILSRCGYNAIALRGRPGKHVHWQLSADERLNIRRLLADHGLQVSAIATYLFLASRDAGTAEQTDTRDEQGNLDELLRWMQLAADLGAETVRVFGGQLSEGESHEAAAPRISRIMAAAAAQFPQTNVAIELHDVWTHPETVGRLLEATGRTNCKAVWDIHATAGAGCSARQTLQLLTAERIAYVQLKDKFTLPCGDVYHCLLGAGETPLKEILSELRRARWSGYLDMEYEALYNKYMPGVEIGAPQSIMKIRQLLGEVE